MWCCKTSFAPTTKVDTSSVQAILCVINRKLKIICGREDNIIKNDWLIDTILRLTWSKALTGVVGNVSVWTMAGCLFLGAYNLDTLINHWISIVVSFWSFFFFLSYLQISLTNELTWLTRLASASSADDKFTRSGWRFRPFLSFDFSDVIVLILGLLQLPFVRFP